MVTDAKGVIPASRHRDRAQKKKTAWRDGPVGAETGYGDRLRLLAFRARQCWNKSGNDYVEHRGRDHRR
jgi:hypothetical protein